MYEQFAALYDNMMSEIPYDDWFVRIHGYLAAHGKKSGHLCELGCGTGQMTGRFRKAGYEVTGIDLSPDMLAAAEDKQDGREKILYLNQDMTDFTLHKLADVILCICDSANYLVEEEQLLSMFRCVWDNLEDGGYFLFDMKTEYCFESILGNGIRLEDEEDYTVIWDNEYDSGTKRNEYLLTMFIRREDGTYERRDEEHIQRAYGEEQIGALLGQAGFARWECMGSGMAGRPGKEDERIYFVAEKRL